MPSTSAAPFSTIARAHPWFNAAHSPIGAHASFTLGFPGPKGGLGLELGGPADQNVYVGLEDAPGSGSYQALPFIGGKSDDAERYEVDNAPAEPDSATKRGRTREFERDEVQRDFSLVRDTWRAGDLTFTIHSPVGALPDPADCPPGSAQETLLRQLLLPAVLVEFTVDNTAGDTARRAYFGFAGNDRYTSMRLIDGTGVGDDSLIGIGQGTNLSTAITTNEPGVRAALGFDPPHIMDAPSERNWQFGLGTMGLLVMDTEPGERRTYRFAVCFHHAGTVTTGLATSYLYTRWYSDVEQVASAALADFDQLVALYGQGADALGLHRLPDERAFMLTHAIRSYYASTQLLESATDPVWVVNEGEYRMINTLDLTVDQAAFEARQHPWTLRNVLDHFADRYAYTDRVKLPGEDTTRPGGVSFPHDMGVATVFSAPGRSAYEVPDLDWCFSYMTGEELLNWTLSAGTYVTKTGDQQWAQHRADLLEACLQSLLARDPHGRGVQTTDSDRCGTGAEITTYDSLDASLGQTRDSLYVAGKTWAAHLWLARVLAELGRTDAADSATAAAERSAALLVSQLGADGTMPALLESAVPARIIPVVEGLAVAYLTGSHDELRPDGKYAALLDALRTHLRTVLVPGICLFADGGWKLSSTSDNSWLSKIYLAQFTARQLLGMHDKAQEQAADAAHVSWLLHPTQSYYGWSDQIVAGRPQGSLYYPRGVTAIVWLDEFTAAN